MSNLMVDLILIHLNVICTRDMRRIHRAEMLTCRASASSITAVPLSELPQLNGALIGSAFDKEHISF
jgi:hypothetical protein